MKIKYLGLIILLIFYPLFVLNCSKSPVSSSTEQSTVDPPSSNPTISKPIPPSNLSVVGGDNSARISWTGTTDASSYKIYKSIVSKTSYELATATTNSIYDVTNLKNGTTYYFAVTSIKGTLESDYSNEVNIIPYMRTVVSGPQKGVSLNNADQVFRSLAVSHTNPNLVYIGTEGNGILKSSDGGVSWSRLRYGLRYSEESPPTSSYYPEIYEIIIDPNNDNIIYAATTSGPGSIEETSVSSSRAGIYKTTNGGEYWLQKSDGLLNTAANCIAFDPSNSSILYAGVTGGLGASINNISPFFESGLYKSTNSGEAWSKIYSPASSNKKVNFWQIIPWDLNIIYALGHRLQNESESSEYMGILKSTDQGANWTIVPTPSQRYFTFFTVAPQDSNLIYALERDVYKVYKTADGGSNWTEIACPASGPIKISPYDKNIIFFGDVSNLYKSNDGLQTYTKVLTPEGTVDDIEFTSNPNIIYAACRGYLNYKSENGGNSFAKIANLREFINANP